MVRGVADVAAARGRAGPLVRHAPARHHRAGPPDRGRRRERRPGPGHRPGRGGTTVGGGDPVPARGLPLHGHDGNVVGGVGVSGGTGEQDQIVVEASEHGWSASLLGAGRRLRCRRRVRRVRARPTRVRRNSRGGGSGGGQAAGQAASWRKG
ncbi:heme-binding protein [Pseudonocardia nantongensis]|uniref:heme-binding protein n=1 Tax=Pseudonocardia nantongensis TaxID=1181885 RepID=UPI00397CB429